MFFLLYLQLVLSCDFQYELSDHDPLYIEQFLQPDQTLCINITVEYAIFIFNSLDNSTFKIFDQLNKERSLGYEEKNKEATAISFGKMIGSLVISNLKAANESKPSFISISMISFPPDECEIKMISNDIKNYAIISFEDSKVCYFNGNGLHYRYQFYVSDGTVEIRPPKNISKSVIIKRNLNDQPKKIDVKSLIQSYALKLLNKKDISRQFNPIESTNFTDSPDSIFIDHSLTDESNKIFDNPSSILRVDGYSPLIIYKPKHNLSTAVDRSYFMQLGTNYHRYPYRLNLRFVSNEPGIIIGDKEDTNYIENSQNFYYGCNPYIYTTDSAGNSYAIDENGRNVQSYYFEIIAKIIISLLLFYLIVIVITCYALSFCCICPCCCCYKYCNKKICCKNKNNNYRSFNAANTIDFLQARSSVNIGPFHDDNNNNVDDNRESSAYNENVNENQNQNADIVEEEEEVTDNEPIENVEDGFELNDINDSPVRNANPQM